MVRISFVRLSPPDREKVLRYVRYLIIVLLLLAMVGIVLTFVESIFGSPQQAADRIRQMGAWGPIVIVIVIILEVIIAPVPGVIAAVASGYAFGVWWGTLYSYLGNVIGTAIAFFLSRRYGRPLVERFVSRRKVELYDCFVRERGKVLLWFIFLFPFFPADIVSFVTGLSDIKAKDFLFIVAVAYLPNMYLLNKFGATMYESGLHGKTLIFGAILLCVLVVGMIFYRTLQRGQGRRGRARVRGASKPL